MRRVYHFEEKQIACLFLLIHYLFIYLFVVNILTKSGFSQEEVMSDKQEVVSIYSYIQYS